MARGVELGIAALPAVEKWYRKLGNDVQRELQTRLELIKNADIIEKLQRGGATPSGNVERLPLNPNRDKDVDFSTIHQLYLLNLPRKVGMSHVLLFAIHEGQVLLLTHDERVGHDARTGSGANGYDIEGAQAAYAAFLAAHKNPSLPTEGEPAKEGWRSALNGDGKVDNILGNGPSNGKGSRRNGPS